MHGSFPIRDRAKPNDPKGLEATRTGNSTALLGGYAELFCIFSGRYGPAELARISIRSWF